MNQASRVPSRRGARSSPGRAAAPPASPDPINDTKGGPPGNAGLAEGVVGLADVLEELRLLRAALTNPAQPVPRKLLRLDEIAESFGLDRRTLERLRSSARFPAPSVQVGKVPLWAPEALEAWIAAGGQIR